MTASAEENIVGGCERNSRHRLIEAVRFWVRVHSNAAEVGAERRLHLESYPRIESLPASPGPARWRTRCPGRPLLRHRLGWPLAKTRCT